MLVSTPLLRSEANMYYTNGRPDTADNYSIDGINANIGLINDASAAPVKAGVGLPTAANFNGFSFESVKEFGVSAWIYKADSVLGSGKQISISSRSGTNQFHGTLFESFGSDHLNANNWFANSRGIRKPVSQANTFGGTFGGPIKTGKLFFFTNYEGLRLRQGSFALTDVPSLNARQNAPSSVKPLLNAFPLPNGAARNDGFAEFASAFTTPATTNLSSIRLDYNPASKLQLSGIYRYANSYAQTRGDDGFSLNTLKRTDNQIQIATGKSTYTPTPNLVLYTSVNYSRASLGQAYHTDDFGGANVISSDAQALFANGFSLSQYDLYGRNSAIASSEKVSGKLEQFNFASGAGYVINNHSFQFGADYRRLSLTTSAQPDERAVLFSGINGALSGIAARTNFFSRVDSQTPRINEFYAYFQDDWRVRPTLTLNFGMLWGINKPLSSSSNQKPLALINTSLPFSNNMAANDVALWKTTYNNFAPRIGFSYSIDDAGKNVIRAGLGWFYDSANINAVEIFGHAFPFSNGTVAFNQPLSSLSQNQTPNKTFVGYDPNLKLPLIRQWSVTFIREISNSMSISATYTGSQGRRLLLTKTFLNQDPAFPFARLTTNEGESDYNTFQVRFQRRFSKGFSFLLNYNFAKSLDNLSTDSLSKAVIATPQQDRGFSDFDTRHLVNGYVMYETPNEFENKHLSYLFRNWSITTYLNLRSALPVNVVYGHVNNFGISYLRPDMVQTAQTFSGNQINAYAFAIPTNERQGTLTRNSLRAHPFYQVDLGASRKINITQEKSLTFRLGVINLFNHTNFAAPSFFDLSPGTFFPNGSFLPNSTFGQTSSLASTATERSIGQRIFSGYQANASRSLQLSVKFNF